MSCGVWHRTLALDPLGPVLSDASSRGTRGEASAVDSFISLELFPQVLWYGRTHGADGISCSYPSVLSEVRRREALSNNMMHMGLVM